MIEIKIKNKSVRYILFLTLFVGMFIPLINISFIIPAFTNLLIKNTENDAVRATQHLTSMLKQEYPELRRDSLTPDLINKVKIFQRDLQFRKLKLFSRDGETIYSSEPGDIERLNDKPYIIESLLKGRPFSKVVKIETISLDGKPETTEIVDIYVPIMSNNTYLGVCEIYYDITRRKQELIKLVLKAGFIPFTMMLGGLTLTIVILIQLDKSIARQKKAENELRAFAKRLQRSNRELESFAHIASHDLQEPLRKVTAFGDRLISKYREALDEQGRDYLRRMQDATRRMQNLINSLLTFSRVTTKAQPFVPVDLNKIVREVVSDLEVGIEKKGGHIEVGNLMTIDADPLQIRQLLQNLIGNALKFSKKDVPPVVKIHGKVIHDEGGTSNNKYYQISVEDNGIGFDEKYAERIFDVFQRLHGRQEYEGSGIGLSICRKIVERHNGRIMAKSSPWQGSTFIVTLPIKQEKGGEDGYKG